MARLGTPENPEVIEPGRPARDHQMSSPRTSRLRTLTRLVTFTVLALTPAVIFDGAAWWLLREGWRAGNPLAWLVMLLILPGAALATLFALVATPVLLLSLVFLVMGRPVTVTGFNVASRFRSFR